MLEHHFWETFRKWVPHPEVGEVYDVEEIGFEEDGFVVLLRPDHFQEEKRSQWALRLVWDRILSYTVTDESYRPELWVSEKTPDWALWTFYLSETSDHLTRFREENYLVPEEPHHFFICATNLMADILSDEYPTVTFIKRDTELQKCTNVQR